MLKTKSFAMAIAVSLALPAQAGLLGPLGGTGLSGEYAGFTDSPFSGLNFSYFHLEGSKGPGLH